MKVNGMGSCIICFYNHVCPHIRRRELIHVGGVAVGSVVLVYLLEDRVRPCYFHGGAILYVLLGDAERLQIRAIYNKPTAGISNTVSS